jgi:hypothetical protein
MLNPESRTIAPIVIALTGLCRGITQDSIILGYDDVLTLPYHDETRFLKCTNSIEVINSRELRHELRKDFYFAHFTFMCNLFCNFQILPYRDFDILKGFLLSSALRPAAGKARAAYGETLFGFIQNDWIFHDISSGPAGFHLRLKMERLTNSQPRVFPASLLTLEDLSLRDASSRCGPSTWNSIASRMLRLTSARVAPVAAQPLNSGEYAEKPVPVFSITMR